MKRTSCSVLETRVKDRHSGKPFVCRLRRFSGQNQSPHIAPSDEHQRSILFELLDELSEHPNNYRQFQTVANPHTVAFRDKLGVGYRIDSVAEVNVADSTPKVELHYNIGDQCHGTVILYLKPRRAPPPITPHGRDWRDTLVDDEEETNFTHSLVMSYISEGLQDSAAHQHVNEIEWEVEEAGNDVDPRAGGLVKAAMSGRSLPSEEGKIKSGLGERGFEESNKEDDDAEDKGKDKKAGLEAEEAGPHTGALEGEGPEGGPVGGPVGANWEKLARTVTSALTSGEEVPPTEGAKVKGGLGERGFEEMNEEDRKGEQRTI